MEFTKTEFKEVLELGIGGAISNLMEFGSVAPMAMIVTKIDPEEFITQQTGPKFGLGLCPLDFSNDDNKYDSMEALKTHAKELNAVAVFLISEGWASVKKPEELDNTDFVRPSKDPNRRELITVVGTSPILRGMKSQYFHRSGDEIVLDEQTELFSDDKEAGIQTNLMSGFWETTH
jgi:hypothetical protein